MATIARRIGVAVTPQREAASVSVDARWWRAFVTRHRLLGALVAGLIATQVATVTGYWYHGLRLVDLDWPAFNGVLLLPKSDANAQFWAGTAYHYADGVVFALIFVILLRPLMRFAFASSTLTNISKALVFGVGLAILSAAWWVPGLFPALDAGTFSANLGAKTVFGIFLWHLVYGFNLGAVYNPLTPEELTEADT